MGLAHYFYCTSFLKGDVTQEVKGIYRIRLAFVDTSPENKWEDIRQFHILLNIARVRTLSVLEPSLIYN